MQLRYSNGTILIDEPINSPLVVYDNRIKSYRTLGKNYRFILEYLQQQQIDFKDLVLRSQEMPVLTSKMKLRSYQHIAVKHWMKPKRGLIVMPTGAGKTMVALKIIETMLCSTIVIVPTLDLVMQWKKILEDTFQIEIGEFTGNLKDIKPITVSTYDSALINAERLGNRFQLLVFDEVHHLPSESYKQIAEMFIAPFRLGLTATYERSDEGHLEFPELIGDIVYEVSTARLQGKYLAEYDYNKLILALNEEEQGQYDRYNTEFRTYLQQHKLIFHTPNDFRKIVMRSGRDPQARQALLAHNIAEKIAFNSQTKIAKLRELLSLSNRTIIFTRYNEMVYTISRQFLIPCITHHTKDQERKEIMAKFKTGEYHAIVCSQVLDEGIDVPEANVGIIMSGNGSPRSQIQRLGRLLRPQEGKRAQLWELISKGTKEMGTSQRRKLSEGN